MKTTREIAFALTMKLPEPIPTLALECNATILKVENSSFAPYLIIIEGRQHRAENEQGITRILKSFLRK